MIIITGASDGLGHEVAKIYSKAGKTVVNISRRPCPLATQNILTNLSDPTAITNAAKEIEAIAEPVEALINCAGVFSSQPLATIDEKELDRVFAVNVEAPVLLVSALCDRLKKDGADIVNVASTAGLKGNQDQAAYGASKWAMRGFSANLQTELRGTPCRVISFCPGGFKSKLFEKATGFDNTNTGSWMNPEDLALFIKNILDLPKNMEVSEVIVNRK